MSEETLSTREQMKVLAEKLSGEERDQVKIFLDWLKSEKGQELATQLNDLQANSVPGGDVERTTQNILATVNAAATILPNYLPYAVEQAAPVPDGTPLPDSQLLRPGE